MLQVLKEEMGGSLQKKPNSRDLLGLELSQSAWFHQYPSLFRCFGARLRLASFLSRFRLCAEITNNRGLSESYESWAVIGMLVSDYFK